MPAAWDVHPDFGLLCISARLRRRLRLGFFFACALLAGTIAYRLDVAQDGTEARQAFALAPAHASRAVAPEPRATSEALAERRSSRLCAGTPSFLDGTCTFGAPRRMQHVRSLAAPPALASVLIGRAGAPAVQATDAPPRSTAAEAADEAVSASIVTQPAATEAPAQSAHPERKQAHGEAGKRHHAVAAHYAEQGRRASTGRGGWGSLW